MCIFWGKIHYMYAFENNRTPFHPKQEPRYDCPLSTKNLSDLFSHCGDFEKREFIYGLDGSVRLNLCWIDGLVSTPMLSQNVLRPLTQLARCGVACDQHTAWQRIAAGGVYNCVVRRCEDMDSLVELITHGFCALIFDELSAALCFEVRSEINRAISEPTLEKALKGAKDSFVENIRINTALIRRRISDPALKLLESQLGRKSATRAALIYIEGVACPETVEAVASRLDAMDVDALLATGIVEESVVDHPDSPFPQLIHTERPDRFSMYLTEGRVGILIDGIPVGLVLPVTMAEFMKVTGDSGKHYIVASSIAMLRYAALLLGALLPALYVGIAMYHQEMIPTKLLLSIIEAKRDVPFSTALEVLGMLMAFSLLQEAGLRLPNPIGDTVSIIGALIVGQSAVEARVVSPIAIIVVAVSGIASYTLPSQDLSFAVKLCRLILLLAAIVGGLYGVGIGICLIMLHLAKMDSFGVNYTSPLSDGLPGGLLRLFLRLPKRKNKFRDPLLNTPDRRKQK